MKIPKIILKVIFMLLVFSCSTDENSSDDSEPINNMRLVKREYVSSNLNLEYRYNQNNLLDKIIDIDIQQNIDSETNFIYNSNNVTSQNFSSNSSNFNSIRNFSYDNNNRLLSVISTNNTDNITITQEYSYANNIITVNTNWSSGESSTIELEQNNNGLVTKISHSENYSTIDYDNQQNITTINVFDNSNNLLHISRFEYDNNSNPFFGQLSSIYLHLFLNAFIDFEVGEFVWDGYEGYYFPFLKNNITTIIENGNLNRNYQYAYDNENYPINVIEVFNGVNSFEFDIEYE